MSIQEVRVFNRQDLPDPRGSELMYEIQNSLQIEGIERVRTARVYRFEGVGRQEAAVLGEKLLSESIFQQYTLNSPVFADASGLVEVAYKPGVMNPEAGSLLKSASDLGIEGLLAADSSTEYAFYGTGATQDNMKMIVEKLLVNETVQRVVQGTPDTLVIKGVPGGTSIISVRQMNQEQLMELSRDKLFLNLTEMLTIKEYFTDLKRDPTDCEIETIAQTWSEHCGHKTFRAALEVDHVIKEPLLKRLQNATREASHPLVLSAFVDNSGVMELYEGWAICGKVETHNSPSAIEPYGGAMTGSGGVFRDIMGTGTGARVVASTDMFCFAPPNTPRQNIPAGCLHPNYLLRRVVAGVRDYGNRMGIPTNNGSVHFHPDFRAKPSIIVGAYGILRAQGCRKGSPKPGDLAVVIGGRTGRDGIHGATFSSGEMTDKTVDKNSSAVQIGHAIEEKRTSDALLAATREGLVRAVTDCGAGGFASALGEMGEEIGVEVQLKGAPLKYPGLSPWEIWLSESQERMVIALEPARLGRFMELCSLYNVEATQLGRFTGDKKLKVLYGDEIVCHLEMDFLHNGLPKRSLRAKARAVQPGNDGTAEKQPRAMDLKDAYLQVMGHLNVCSKEPIIRMYDHGVQGTCALPPLAGVHGDAPNDAVILTPVPGKNYGMFISHGLNPVLNTIDPYYGSLWAAAEAVSNAVAAGVNPRDICLIDNFIWPFPDEESLWDLDRSVDACVDFVRATGMPFISGKDSLSSTYRSSEALIKIPPVLCVSAFGRVPDVQRTVSSDFKVPGSQIVLVGKRDVSEMAGSAYCDVTRSQGRNLPRLDLGAFNAAINCVHSAILSGQVLACHDVSEGGLAAGLAEMCMGGSLGAAISVPDGLTPEEFLFNETAGVFIVEMPFDTELEDYFGTVPHMALGRTVSVARVVALRGEDIILDMGLDALKEAWQKPLKEVFGA